MIFTGQIDKFVTKLTELTAKDKVELARDRQCSTHISRPSTNLLSRLTEPDSEVFGGFSFQISGRHGRAVEGVIALVGPRKVDLENTNWERLRDLYEIAQSAGPSFRKSGF